MVNQARALAVHLTHGGLHGRLCGALCGELCTYPFP